jgi:apolipoprotein N-acyltransferase
MRALETERYLVQASNDGMTAAVDARGRIVASLPQFVEGVMHADIEPRSGLTPYARFGNYPVVAGALGLLGLAVWRRRNAR